MANIIDASIFSSKGLMVAEAKYDNGIIRRIEQQQDGSLWGYSFYEGRNKGTPVRGAKWQKHLRIEAQQIKNSIK